MNADGLSLLIAGAAGFVIGSIAWIHVAGLFLNKVRRRAEKETWAAANRYYRQQAAKMD